MGLKQQLQTDLKEALRNRNEEAKSVIRMALAAIGNAEVEKRRDLDEAELLAVLQKEARQREEALAEFRSAGRVDFATRAEAEMVVLKRYLPTLMSREEIVVEARQAIAEVGATGAKQIGQVMQHLMPQMKGRADGRLVNEVVRELLLS
jgi:uncharacterized protein YqeY